SGIGAECVQPAGQVLERVAQAMFGEFLFRQAHQRQQVWCAVVFSQRGLYRPVAGTSVMGALAGAPQPVTAVVAYRQGSVHQDFVLDVLQPQQASVCGSKDRLSLCIERQIRDPGSFAELLQDGGKAAHWRSSSSIAISRASWSESRMD